MEKNTKAKDIEWLNIIKDYLSNVGINDNMVEENVAERNKGKKHSLSDHLRGLVYSLLSNNRTWKKIDENISNIDVIFYDFDVDKVKAQKGSFFADEIRKIKCGNRSIDNQMNNLHKNIETMEMIEQEYGSMDKFIAPKKSSDEDFSYEIVKKISKRESKYKLHYIGEALAWEYLRSVGIDGAKPDTHLRRFFGGDRMGKGNHPKATENEVLETVSRLSEDTGFSKARIDSLVWNYCVTGDNAVCTETPECSACPINKFCNKPM